MNRNLLIKDLQRNLKAFLGWSFAAIIFIGITLGIYSSMRESMSMITALYATLPEAIMEALNFGEDQWNTMLGFYTTYFVYYVPLLGGIYAYHLGGKLLAIEEQNKTAEFLLSRPISRNSIVASKLLVYSFYIIGFNILVYLMGLISCGLASDWDYSILNYSILHVYGVMFCLFIGFLGFFIAVGMKKAHLNMIAGIGIVMGSYIFDMVIRITDKVQFLSYMTPFKYIRIDVISPDYKLEAWRILVLFVASVILASLSFLLYRRKDILV
jgi:ABC-2 type transport system permease protein